MFNLIITTWKRQMEREQRAFEVGLKAGAALGTWRAYMDTWQAFRKQIPDEIAEVADRLIREIGL